MSPRLAMLLLLPGLASTSVLSAGGCRTSGAGSTRPGGAATAQANPEALSLDPTRMFADLEKLSDDALNGRYTKTLSDLRAAADYIAKSHAAAGVAPVGAEYATPFEYVSGKEPGDGYYIWIEREGDTAEFPADAAFAVGFDEKKAVLGEVAWVAPASTKGVKGHVALTPAPAPNELRARLEALQSAGAVGALLTVDVLPGADQRAPLADLAFPTIFVTRTAARTSFGLPDTPAPKSAQALADTQVSLARNEKEVKAMAPNVLAWIEGSERPEEIVLLGAHYDHIGTKDAGTFCRGPSEDADPDDTICNGADDNASGTALLMAVARAFGEAGYRPKRSVVFAHFAGEELGLFGSKGLYEHPPAVPPFAGGEVVAMLNMDMVGRLGPDGLQVGGETTSPSWPEIISAAAPPSLKVIHPEGVTGRSDHAHWFRAGIPVLFFFTGLHDDYHRTSDEFELINQDGMKDIGALVLGVTRALADGAAVPPVPKTGNGPKTSNRL